MARLDSSQMSAAQSTFRVEEYGVDDFDKLHEPRVDDGLDKVHAINIKPDNDREAYSPYDSTDGKNGAEDGMCSMMVADDGDTLFSAWGNGNYQV